MVNERKILSTQIVIDNTPPSVTFVETVGTNGIAKAELRFGEPLRPIDGWEVTSMGLRFQKNFLGPVSYPLPVLDLAENSSQVLVDIKNAHALFLEYGSYDSHSLYYFTTAGKISAPNTISSNSICKTEAIFIKLSDTTSSHSLEGRNYIHTYWGNGFTSICHYSNLAYSHGYSPWIKVSSQNIIYYGKKLFSQLGGVGVNTKNATPTTAYLPIPSEIAKQYLYGISGIQFKLNESSNYSVVYQSYVNGVGWLKSSSDGEENLFKSDKPISSFRMNLVPKSEKQYLIDFWNRDIGTNHID